MLCTDKTGTLTENRMTIAELRLASDEVLPIGPQSGVALPAAFKDLAEFGILASAADPFDPMEKAFHELGRTGLQQGGQPREPEWPGSMPGSMPDLA